MSSKGAQEALSDRRSNNEHDLKEISDHDKVYY